MLSTACSGSGDKAAPTTEPPPARDVRVHYSVSYAGTERTGTATVSYMRGDGNSVSEDVALPWKSTDQRFPATAQISLSAVAPAVADVSLVCEASTDQGPYGRTTAMSGERSCSLAKSLPELAKR